MNKEKSDAFWQLPHVEIKETSKWVQEDGSKRKVVWGGSVDLIIEAKERDDGVTPSLIDPDAY